MALEVTTFFITANLGAFLAFPMAFVWVLSEKRMKIIPVNPENWTGVEKLIEGERREGGCFSR